MCERVLRRNCFRDNSYLGFQIGRSLSQYNNVHDLVLKYQIVYRDGVVCIYFSYAKLSSVMVAISVIYDRASRNASKECPYNVGQYTRLSEDIFGGQWSTLNENLITNIILCLIIYILMLIYLQVSLSFNKQKAKPAEKVDLKIKADPQSLVSVLAVDKSILLLRTGNDITTQDVRIE